MLTERIDALQNEVTTLRAEGKYIETIEACYLLLQLGKEAENYSSMMTAHINHAASFYCLGEMEKALQSIEAHHKICTLHGKDADWMNDYNIRFLVYAFNKEHGQAQETLEKSIRLAKKLAHHNIVSNGYSNWSHIFYELGQFEDALEMAQQGVKFAQLHEPHSPLLLMRATLNLANAMIKLGELAEAKQSIDEMLAAPFLQESPREHGQLHILLARWYEERQDIQQAFDAYTVANDIVSSYKDLSFLREIQQERLRLVDLLENFEEGVFIQKEFIDLLDALEKQKLGQKAMQLETNLKLAALKKKANRDYLTGLYNRSYIEQTTDSWLEDAKTHHETIVCIAFDIDNFKQVNDQHGHLVGDDIIIQVAHACQHIVREDDLLGRFGGDEFVLVMKGISFENGYKKAEQIHKTICDLRHKTEVETIAVTASVGISYNFQPNIGTFKELFYLADLALYTAEAQGKNKVAIYTD